MLRRKKKKKQSEVGGMGVQGRLKGVDCIMLQDGYVIENCFLSRIEGDSGYICFSKCL